jgi:hypothetical protein
VLSYIHSTNEDGDLDVIFDACRARRKTLGSIKAATVKEGDRVRIDGISPKYLAGVTGTVTSIDRSRKGGIAVVEADRPVFGSRHRGETTIAGIPTACLNIL